MMITLRMVLVATIFSTAVASAWQDSAATPRTRVDAFVAALSRGSLDDIERMAQQHYAESLLGARTPEDRRAFSSELRARLGRLTLSNEILRGPEQVELTFRGAQGIVQVTLTLEGSAPFKITSVRFEDGDRNGRGGPGQGRGGPGLPPIPLRPDMPKAELAAAVDAYVAPLAARGEFAGTILIARQGEPLFEKGYGIADRQTDAPVTPSSLFNVASINKMFTRTAIGQLVSAKKLALTDTIGMRLPDYPNAEARAATVEQLLEHTGGIIDIFAPQFQNVREDTLRSNADYFRMISSAAPLFPPGSQTRYCNGCYIVLGEIIAKTSGLPYERYIQDHVFTPARMTTAAFLRYGEPGVAMGYRRDGEGWAPAAMPQGRRGSAAGGAFMRAADLLAFDVALREGRLLDAERTAWVLRIPSATPGQRAPGRLGIAGGTPGANAVVHSNETWTVIVLGNLSPPNAERMGSALMQALSGSVGGRD